MNGEDERIEQEQREQMEALRRKEVTRQEKRDILEAEIEESRELGERNEASMRRIKEDVEVLNDTINANINRAVSQLASLSVNKRNTVVVNNQRVFTNQSVQQAAQSINNTNSN